jgi:hypothetical protein
MTVSPAPASITLATHATSLKCCGSSVAEADPLVARIQQLQAQDDREIQALQQTLDTYDHASGQVVAVRT